MNCGLRAHSELDTLVSLTNTTSTANRMYYLKPYQLRVSAIVSQCDSKITMLYIYIYVLTNPGTQLWDQRFKYNIILNICQHMLTSMKLDVRKTVLISRYGSRAKYI